VSFLYRETASKKLAILGLLHGGFLGAQTREGGKSQDGEMPPLQGDCSTRRLFGGKKKDRQGALKKATASEHKAGQKGRGG